MAVTKRKGSPNWQYRFQVNGSIFRGSTGTPVKREAVAIERKTRAKVESRQVHTEDLTLDSAFGRLVVEHIQHLKPASRQAYDAHIQNLLERIDAYSLLSELSNSTVAQYVAARRVEVQPATVNVELTVLRSLHNRARDLWELPVRGIRWRSHMLPLPKPRDRHISQGEAQRLIAAIHPDTRPALIWSLHTGCRRGETFDLNWGDVDLEQGFAVVNGKTGERRVELSPIVVELLGGMGHREGKVFDATNYRKRFCEARDAVGLGDFRWHDMRHTFATWLRQEGAPIEIVQKALGHTQIATTMRYAAVGQNEVRDAVSRMQMGKAWGAGN